MPLGASRLALLAKPAGVEAVAQRTAVTGITATGTAKLDRGERKFGGASLDLDGNSDLITVPWSNDLGKWNQQAYTLEYWVRLDSLTGTSYPDGHTTEIPNGFGNHNSTGNQNYWSFGPIDDGSVVFYYYNGSKNSLQTTGVTLTTNTWYHLAFVHDGSSGIKIYVDGTERASGTISGTPQFGSGYDLRHGAAGSSTVYMNGRTDELRISTSAKYTANFTVADRKHVNDNADTALLLHFDGRANGTNTDFYDDNGNRAPIVPDYVTGEIDTAQSKFGGSSFFTNSQYIPADINLAQNAELQDITSSSEFTIEFWARRGANTAGDEGLIKGGNQFEIIYDGGSENLEYRADSASTTRITGGSLSVGTWYHIAVVRDTSNNTKMYIDGTQTGSTYTLDDRSWSNIASMYIGGEGTNSDFHIDEMRISNTQRYTSNFTAPTSAFTDDEFTLLLYHFDDSDGAQNIKDDNGMS